MKNATFRQLRVFSEVAKHLSFVRAAESLHLSPPAITMQVKELEGHVGMPLFDRVGKQVSLTAGGEYMLLYARKILANIKDAEDAAARLKHIEAGVLTVGMVGTAKYFMMKLVAEFQAKHEGIGLKLALGNRQQLVDLLVHNEVDIAIMGRPPTEMRTRAEPFAAHPHVFVTAPHHPLLANGELQVEQLRNIELIVRESGSGTLSAMQKFFESARVPARIGHQLPSNEMLKQAVMAGLGVGFVSLHTIGLELQHQLIAVLPVRGAPVVRAWNVVHTQSKMLSPAAEAFRYFMLERGEAYLAQHFGKHLPV